MASMMKQESLDLSFFDENNFDNFVIDFDEIASDVGDITVFDNFKLLENNNVGVDVPALPSAVVVQPASPDIAFTQVQEQPLSRDMFLMQPVSLGTSIESTLSPYSSQTLSPDSIYLQSSTPEPFLMQPASPDQHPVPVEPVLSPYVVHITEEAAPVQIKQQVLPVLSFGDVADAPRKRGRKRKYPEGSARRRNRSTRTKVYQMAPLEDEMAEKRRRNAVNAKLHREKQKYERDHLLLQLEKVISERDGFKKQLEELKQKVAKFQGFMPY